MKPLVLAWVIYAASLVVAIWASTWFATLAATDESGVPPAVYMPHCTPARDGATLVCVGDAGPAKEWRVRW